MFVLFLLGSDVLSLFNGLVQLGRGQAGGSLYKATQTLTVGEMLFGAACGAAVISVLFVFFKARFAPCSFSRDFWVFFSL